jgi:GTP-binding protein EngB required for normal cell division
MTDRTVVLDYLRRFVGDNSLLTPEDIRPLFRLQQDAKFVSSQIPRLILVGEFKAGKSTLMNALLRGEYAATDILEMTSWIARYWPSDLPFCRIMRADGREVEVQPDEFKQKCQSRDFTQNELSQISRVDIGLPISTMTFSIIDCPGLGSVTRENERRMVDALQDADVIVWAVDVDSIGGMREGALLQKLLSQGMPHITVLTKCDLISESEIDEIKQFLCDEFSLKKQDIFSTSARKALEEIKQGRQLSKGTGIPQLDHYIRHDVSTRHGELRRQAEHAHISRINEQALMLVGRVHDELLTAKDALDRFKNIAVNMRKAVQGQLEMEVEGMVRERMFADHRTAIVNDIETSLKSGKGSLSQDSITAIFKKNLGEKYLDSFWQDISTSMTTSASQLWMDKLKDVQVELDEICQRFQSASWHELAVTQSPQAMALNISAISNETFSTALKTSFGIAGFATVYAAATAHVSLLAAATGVGIPIAAIGAVVSSALFYFQKNKSQNAAALEATVLVDSYVKHFIEDILRPHLFPQIAELNENIERQMVAGFEQNVKANLPSDNLEDLLNDAIKYKKELQSLVGAKLLK